VTLRSTWISAILALVLSVGLTVLVSWVTGWSWDDWSEADKASFDPITFSIIGIIISGIVFVVMGVQLVASEYSSGMIRQTMTTTPRRERVFLAKVLVVGIATLVLGAVIGLANFLAAQAVFGAYDMRSASVTDGDASRMLIGLTATAPMFPIIGVSAAFILRSAAGAITLVLGLLFVPSMFGALLPRRWQEDVLAYLPGSLADSVSLHHLDPDNTLYVDPALASIVLVGWLILVCGAALVMLKRRDV
jgi:ABC-type transport system involved in multi-copper enzyme maturation permease subunit